jgi:HSP20 family protein
MLHHIPASSTGKVLARTTLPLYSMNMGKSPEKLIILSEPMKRSYSTPVRHFRTILSPLVPSTRQPTTVEVTPAALTPLPSLFRDLDELFFRSSPFLNPSNVLSFMRRDWDLWNDDDDISKRRKHFLPGYDIASTDTSVKIFMDLPGVKMEDVTIEVENEKILRVRGDRKIIKKMEGEEESKSEIHFEKSFSLDTSVDTSNIVANLTDGVLTITIPKILEKVEEKAVRKIEVKAGGQGLES